jgi:hypothetical protein
MARIPSVFVGFDLDSGGSEFILGTTLRGLGSSGSLPIYTDPVALADAVANPTVGGSQTFGLYYNGATWDRILGDATDGLLVNMGGNNDVTVTSGAITADTELPAAAAMTTDSIANPTSPSVTSHLVGYDRVNDDWTRIAGLVDGEVVGATNAGFLQFGSDGSNYQAILTDATGALQVDVLSGGGGAPAPTNPVNDVQSLTALAAQTPTDLDSSSADSKRLTQIEITSSAPFVAELRTVDDGTPSGIVAMLGGPAHACFVYVPPHPDYIQLGANAGLDAFRLNIENLDNNQAADVQVVYHYEDL